MSLALDKTKIPRCSKLNYRDRRVRQRDRTVTLLTAVDQPTKDCSISRLLERQMHGQVAVSTIIPKRQNSPAPQNPRSLSLPCVWRVSLCSPPSHAATSGLDLASQDLPSFLASILAQKTLYKKFSAMKVLCLTH